MIECGKDTPMYGKHFTSMYSGSMVGAGALYFAVWGYVISHARPDATVGTQVELNPIILKTIIGDVQVADIEAVISRMCLPDPKSRTKDQEGRKLVKLGEFDYQVVNGAKYRAIRDQEKRRTQNREAQARYREKKAAENSVKEFANPHDGMTQLQKVQLKAEQNDDHDTAQRCAEIDAEIDPGTLSEPEQYPDEPAF